MFKIVYSSDVFIQLLQLIKSFFQYWDINWVSQTYNESIEYGGSLELSHGSSVSFWNAFASIHVDILAIGFLSLNHEELLKVND